MCERVILRYGFWLVLVKQCNRWIRLLQMGPFITEFVGTVAKGEYRGIDPEYERNSEPLQVRRVLCRQGAYDCTHSNFR